MVILPTKKSPARDIDPKLLVLFGKPKSGKTTFLSSIDNCLIVDINNGSNYLECMSIKASDLSGLQEIRNAIVEANKPYKYIAIDTVTDLEEMIMPLAVKRYKETPKLMGLL